MYARVIFRCESLVFCHVSVVTLIIGARATARPVLCHIQAINVTQSLHTFIHTYFSSLHTHEREHTHMCNPTRTCFHLMCVCLMVRENTHAFCTDSKELHEWRGI